MKIYFDALTLAEVSIRLRITHQVPIYTDATKCLCIFGKSFKWEKNLLTKIRWTLVLSTAQHSQLIRIFNMLTSCYTMLSDSCRNNLNILCVQ